MSIFGAKPNWLQRKQIQAKHLNTIKPERNITGMSENNDIIVVLSDVHFGHPGCCHIEISGFIDWLKQLETVRSIDMDIEGYKRTTIRSPSKLILLGDIFELWSPMDDQTFHVFGQSSGVIGRIMELSCTKILVLGNHDESLDVLARDAPYTLSNGSLIYICNKHYPPGKGDFDEIGGRKYFFMHGHQFDKMFEWAGPLRRFPGAMMGMKTQFEKIGSWVSPLGALIFFISLCYLLISAVSTWIWVLLVISLFFGFPWIFSKIRAPIWKRLREHVDKPKGKRIFEIVNGRYFKSDKAEDISANTIVFGHTHVADQKTNHVGGMLINTGCWVQENGILHPTSFVYIDGQEGPLLLEWDNKERALKKIPPPSG